MGNAWPFSSYYSALTIIFYFLLLFSYYYSALTFSSNYCSYSSLVAFINSISKNLNEHWVIILSSLNVDFLAGKYCVYDVTHYFDSIIYHDSWVLQEVLFTMRTSSENLNKLLFWHNQKRHLLFKKVKIWDILS